MEENKKKNHSLTISISLIIFLIIGLTIVYFVKKINDPWPQNRVWQSDKTVEENIIDIRERTVEKHGEHYEIDIYVLSSFDDHPEFFLVQVGDYMHHIVLYYRGEYYNIHGGGGYSFWARLNVLENSEYQIYCAPDFYAYKHQGIMYVISMRGYMFEEDYNIENFKNNSVDEENYKYYILNERDISQLGNKWNPIY